MLRYRYTHEVPTTFIDLVKDGKTWTPELGDEIDSSIQINHPYLELIAQEVADETPIIEAPKKLKDPPIVEKDETTAPDDATIGDDVKES